MIHEVILYKKNFGHVESRYIYTTSENETSYNSRMALSGYPHIKKYGILPNSNHRHLYDAIAVATTYKI